MNPPRQFLAKPLTEILSMKYCFLLILFLSSVSFLAACSSSSRFSSEKPQKPSLKYSISNKKPAENAPISLQGMASYYGPKYHGRKTSSGEVFDMYQLTAAHRAFAFGTKLRVTNLVNGKTVIVRVNDRGPFVGDRIIDLSYAAAKQIEMLSTGVVEVKLEKL